MNTKKKVTFILMSIIFLLFLLLIANIIYNFRDYGIKSINEKANAVAQTIKHSLTSQMVSGDISNREIFLNQLHDLKTIDKIWISRGKNVIEQYGKGLNEELARDEIDRQVLKTGKTIKIIDENLFSGSSYRITIPYKASAEGKINCTVCHSNAKIGDTLGAITLIMSVDNSKNAGIKTIVNSAIIALLVMITILIFINYLISPFLTIFDKIKKVMHKAQKGNYSYRVEGAQGKEAQDVAKWINTVLDKLENTLVSIDEKISIFITDSHHKEKDDLINVKNTVYRLSDVYKFRKTIENDETLEAIYERFASVLRNKFELKDFNIFEADTIHDKITAVYSENSIYCNAQENGCRADKTNTIIDSAQFDKICKGCHSQSNYVCIPFSISNELDLIISIYIENQSTQGVKEIISNIKDYVDAAKTVIVSKKLMNILEHNANCDALTGLYNRKYLDDSIEKISAQAKRSNISFGILMIDIDHFKEVNDTYGHDVGDHAIKVLSQTLLENIRNSDIAIRYGGEEFIVLLYDCDINFVKGLAEKIRIAFEMKKITAGNNVIKKTISIGTSVYPIDNDDILKCIKYADLALYEAKENGRNQIVSFQSDFEN